MALHTEVLGCRLQEVKDLVVVDLWAGRRIKDRASQGIVQVNSDNGGREEGVPHTSRNEHLHMKVLFICMAEGISPYDRVRDNRAR